MNIMQHKCHKKTQKTFDTFLHCLQIFLIKMHQMNQQLLSWSLMSSNSVETEKKCQYIWTDILEDMERTLLKMNSLSLPLGSPIGTTLLIPASIHFMIIISLKMLRGKILFNFGLMTNLSNSSKQNWYYIHVKSSPLEYLMSYDHFSKRQVMRTLAPFFCFTNSSVISPLSDHVNIFGWCYVLLLLSALSLFSHLIIFWSIINLTFVENISNFHKALWCYNWNSFCFHNKWDWSVYGH